MTASCARAPPPDDTLRVAVAAPPEALDPRRATSAVAMRLSALVAPPLVVIGQDLQPAFAGRDGGSDVARTPDVQGRGASPRGSWALAERIDRPTPTSLVVKLEAGRRFHDGAPVTAHDVKWTFDSMRDPAFGSPHRGKLARLRDVVVVDELTVRFELDGPWAPFLVDLNGYGILSRASCARDPTRDPTRDACRHAPVGAGPYRVARALDDDETLLLEAAPAQAGRAARIPRIHVKVARDPTTRLLELMDERIDLVPGDVAPADLEVVAREEALAIESAPGVGFTYLAFNVRGPPAPGAGAHQRVSAEEERTLRALADPRVRRALALALDVDRVIETKLRGRARRASGMLPEGHWAKPAGDAPLPYDPAGARALLDEAGFPEGAAGAEGGARFRLVLSTTTDRARRAIAVVFAEAWRAVGVDVEVRVKDWAALYEDIQGGAFHAFSAKWVPVVEPDLMHWVFSSTNIPAPGGPGGPGGAPAPRKAGGNRGGFVDLELDAWLAAAQASTDVDERRALYAKASARVALALPVVPLWFEDEIAVRHRRVRGLEWQRTGSLLPLADAWLAPRADDEKAPE